MGGLLNEKKFLSRIISKHDIEENWLKAKNFIPQKAEFIVYDIDDNYTYERFKIGDGNTNVNDLPFIDHQAIVDIESPDVTKHASLYKNGNVLTEYENGAAIDVIVVSTLPTENIIPFADDLDVTTKITMYYEILSNACYGYYANTWNNLNIPVIFTTNDATNPDSEYCLVYPTLNRHAIFRTLNANGDDVFYTYTKDGIGLVELLTENSESIANLANSIEEANESIGNIEDAIDSIDEKLAEVEEKSFNKDNGLQIPLTYNELKELRDNSELIPGAFYRITDYECTTIQENTMAMDNKFDIIVQALSNNTLSEVASADYHYNEDGTVDGYFQKVSVGNFKLNILFTIFEDEGEMTEEYALDADVFIAYDYLENPDGDTVPVLYKTDMNSFPDEVDYADTFYYVGTYEYDGDVYDRWRKIDHEFQWDSSAKRYVLTDVVIQDGTFSDSIVNSVSEDIKVANIPAWELKYCLDNDTTRFGWADKDTGRGVIYWMKDEWNNECPYDFKNIQFLRNISLDNGRPDLDDENGDETWVYTFCGTNTNDIELKDGSLESPYAHQCDEIDELYSFSDNIIKPFVKGYDDDNDDPTKVGVMYLNNIVMLGYWDGRDLSIGGFSYFNGCKANIFGNNCFDITLSGGCYSNTFGNQCYNIIFGIMCRSNTFVDYCHNIIFGSNCYYNTFGNQCYNIIFGSNCYYNTFGGYCGEIIFGDFYAHNTFGNSCYEIRFCNSSSDLINYVKFIRFADYCRFITLLNSEIGDDSKNIQNIVVSEGVKGLYDYRLELEVSRNAPPVVYEATGTTHIILD